MKDVFLARVWLVVGFPPTVHRARKRYTTQLKNRFLLVKLFLDPHELE